MAYKSFLRVCTYCSLFYVVGLQQACEDTGIHRNISITDFPGGKKSALSFTFDDGCYSVITKIAPLFELYGYKATFFIVPGYIKSDEYWMEWKRLSDLGFEIGNHSLTHADLRETEDHVILNQEINDSYDLIAHKIGIAPFSFAHPYHKTSRAADAIVFERHYASKVSPESFCSLYSIDPGQPERFDQVMQDGIKKGKWIVTSAHGVNDCFNPLSEDDLNAILLIARGYEGDVAIGTFEEIAKYRIEKSNSMVLTEETPTVIRISLFTLVGSPVYDVSLTIKVADPSLIHCTIKSTDPLNHIRHFVKDNELFIEMMPGSTVELIR